MDLVSCRVSFLIVRNPLPLLALIIRQLPLPDYLQMPVNDPQLDAISALVRLLRDIQWWLLGPQTPNRLCNRFQIYLRYLSPAYGAGFSIQNHRQPDGSSQQYPQPRMRTCPVMSLAELIVVIAGAPVRLPTTVHNQKSESVFQQRQAQLLTWKAGRQRTPGGSNLFMASAQQWQAWLTLPNALNLFFRFDDLPHRKHHISDFSTSLSWLLRILDFELTPFNVTSLVVSPRYLIKYRQFYFLRTSVRIFLEELSGRQENCHQWWRSFSLLKRFCFWRWVYFEDE